MQIAQRVATQAVQAVLDGRSLTAALGPLLAVTRDARERAAARDIASGTLRHLGRIRAILAQLLPKPLTDPLVGSLLACGIYQLEHTRAPSHAVVHQAVEAIASLDRRWARGLVNAVLRRYQRERDALVAAAQASDVGRWSHPDWWIARLRAQYGDAAEAILERGNQRPLFGLRVNRRRGTREAYLERLARRGLGAAPRGEDGILVERPVAVDELPDFEAGLVSVQDIGAQLAASLLAPADGMRVLDACAAPGGKTCHLLERSDLDLLALDADPERLSRVRENLDRLGLRAELCAADAGDPAAWWDGRPFDRILADVPCTASGVARRHPDVKWLRRESDLDGFGRRQAALLDALWQLLAPGGKLLYATCSVFQEENRVQVDRFLSRHIDARVAPLPGTSEADVQLLPDDSHDGFYYALLERA